MCDHLNKEKQSRDGDTNNKEERLKTNKLGCGSIHSVQESLDVLVSFHMLQVIPQVVGLVALCAEFTCCQCTKLIHFLTCTGIPCRDSHCENGRVRYCLYTGCPSLHKHDCVVTHPNFVESILCVSHNICNASLPSSPRTPRVASPSYLGTSSLADRVCSTFCLHLVNRYRCSSLATSAMARGFDSQATGFGSQHCGSATMSMCSMCEG